VCLDAARLLAAALTRCFCAVIKTCSLTAFNALTAVVPEIVEADAVSIELAAVLGRIAARLLTAAPLELDRAVFLPIFAPV